MNSISHTLGFYFRLIGRPCIQCFYHCFSLDKSKPLGREWWFLIYLNFLELTLDVDGGLLSVQFVDQVPQNKIVEVALDLTAKVIYDAQEFTVSFVVMS